MVDVDHGLGAVHLDRGRVGRVQLVVGHRGGELPVEQVHGVEQGVAPGQVGAHPRQGQHAVLGGPVPDVGVELVGLAGVGGQADALVVELGGDHLPPPVLLADQVGDRHPHVVVVGRGRPVLPDRHDRRPREPGGVGRHQDHGDAPVLLGLGVGPAGQPHPVGVVGPAGEDLVPVDDVLVAIAHRSGLQGGEVGARAGLGVADGEVHLTGHDLGQERGLLLVAPVAHQGRADGVQGDEGDRGLRPLHLVVEDELVGGRAALAAELLRPADAEPAVGAHLLDDAPPALTALAPVPDVGPDLGAEQLGEVGPQLGAQGLLLVGLLEVHLRPLQLSERDILVGSGFTG